MIVMPIVNGGKVYNVKISPKYTYEDRGLETFEKRYESDIVVNGNSYNQSRYNIEKAPLNNTIDFIRNNSLFISSTFLVTSRRNGDGKISTFRIATPPVFVSKGLDLLYSSVIQNMKKSIPGREKDRNVSLKRFGVTEHITETNLSLLRKVTQFGYINETSEFLNDNRINQLYQTLNFLNTFDCTIIEEATMEEKALRDMIFSFNGIETKEARLLHDYYEMAKENSEEYVKLDYLSRIMTGEALHWIRRESSITKIKSWDRNDRHVA